MFTDEPNHGNDKKDLPSTCEGVIKLTIKQKREDLWPSEEQLNDISDLYKGFLAKQNTDQLEDVDKIYNAIAIANMVSNRIFLHQSHIAKLTGLTEARVKYKLDDAEELCLLLMGLVYRNERGVGYRIGWHINDYRFERAKSILRGIGHLKSFMYQSARGKYEIQATEKQDPMDIRFDAKLESAAIYIESFVKGIEADIRSALHGRLQAEFDHSSLEAKKPNFDKDYQ